MAPKTLPTIASNSLTAFLAKVFRRSTIMFSHFLILSSSFGGEDQEGLKPSSNMPVMKNKIIEIVGDSKY